MKTPILATADSHVDATFAARINRRAACRASEDARGARIMARFERLVAAGRVEEAEALFELTAPGA